MKRPPGRPSLYTDELAQEIVSRLAAGETMKSICSAAHMPEVWTVWNWRETKPEFSKLIQRAREAQSESMLDDCQALADDAARVALDPECGSASVAAKKLAIETRLKVAGRFAPERFGERVRQDVAGVPGAPLERKITLDPEQLAQLQEDEKTALETIVGKLHP
ncbi:MULTISPECIES: hypothetical protein [unclassified Akkermansia]|uniref:terminase small subunit-like protein n=1 Tax=unclassified Akkermansia TaxID=2608915 RepID=UPI002F91B0CA